MRLIDADVLCEYWHISEKCEECHWNNRDCSKPPYYSLHDICGAIYEVPTIDAIPVEWLRGLKEKLYGNSNGLAYRMLLDVILNIWQKEQEAMA